MRLSFARRFVRVTTMPAIIVAVAATGHLPAFTRILFTDGYDTFIPMALMVMMQMSVVYIVYVAIMLNFRVP